MGNLSSNLNRAIHSAAIDRQINKDSKILKKECKILLLGKSLSFNPSQPAAGVRLWEVCSSSGTEPSHRSLISLVSSSRGWPIVGQRSTLTIRPPINFIVPPQQTSNPGRWADALFLGTGESGKSTIVKQMKIIHQNGFSDQDRANYRHVVYKNLMESAQCLILAMRKLGIVPEEPIN